MADQNHPKIAVVMPVHGRPEQSITTIQQLITTARYDADFVAASGVNDGATLAGMPRSVKRLMSPSPVLTYWQALHYATEKYSDDTYIVNVANDVLGVTGWLLRAAEYVQLNPHAVFGFNGDGYTVEHACHFCISMKRIRQTGGWPQWYFHNFGDTEIVTRAIEDGIFHKDAWAILFHNHPQVAASAYDDVYLSGNKHFERDMKLFQQRRQGKWTF